MTNEKDENENEELFMFFVYPYIFVGFFFLIGDLFAKGNLITALIDTGKVLLLTLCGFTLFSFFFLIFALVLALYLDR